MTDQKPKTMLSVAVPEPAEIEVKKLHVMGQAVTDIITKDKAIDILVAEGHGRADVEAAWNSMVDAGLKLSQSDGGYIINTEGLKVLREQPNQTGHRYDDTCEHVPTGREPTCMFSSPPCDQ